MTGECEREREREKEESCVVAARRVGGREVLKSWKSRRREPSKFTKKELPVGFLSLAVASMEGTKAALPITACALEAMRACGAAGRCQAGSAVLHTPGSCCNLLPTSIYVRYLAFILVLPRQAFHVASSSGHVPHPHGDSNPAFVLHLKPSRTRTMRRAA